jgi:LDH2 family malate/lactate/ureidoglycolate dehydrogenase
MIATLVHEDRRTGMKNIICTLRDYVKAPRKCLGSDQHTVMAVAKFGLLQIEVQRRKGEPITEGWAQDAQGQSTTDADLAFKTKCLMPLGGPEITSGYKGYGLGLLVETFCGILSGKVGL